VAEGAVGFHACHPSLAAVTTSLVSDVHSPGIKQEVDQEYPKCGQMMFMMQDSRFP